MHTAPQNKDKFTINNLFYCFKALNFTHPRVFEFLCGPKHMGTPVWMGTCQGNRALLGDPEYVFLEKFADWMG